MADIRLFDISSGVKPLKGGGVTLEKELQTVIEKNMETFFGVTFLASEYVTTNGGRMDSLGIDENFCPVIFEYKRSKNENVINQGLFYLDWLLEHKDSFKVLVIEKLGMETASKIDWTMPRVICIAGDFNRYDESAINQMNRNITLIRYKKFEDNLLMFEQLNQNVVKPLDDTVVVENQEEKKRHFYKTFSEKLSDADDNIVSLYNDVRNYIISFGDDITETILKYYTAFKKIENFICAEVYKSKILLYLKLDASTVKYEKNFSRDVTNIGHYGTGNVELELKSVNEFEKAKPLIERAYNEN